MHSTFNTFERGSEWRIWDLHIHTPFSINQNYGGVNAWDKFIAALENLPKEVKVIGINDYYFIEGYQKVMEYKRKGRLTNLDKIFPILEFRIDTFGSGNENKLQKINLHIIFDINEEKLDEELGKIKKEFISKIPLTRLEKHKTKSLSVENLITEGGSLQEGFSSLIPPTEKVFDLLDSSTWKHKCFLLLGYKEWSNLDKNNQLKPFKEDLYNKVSAFFTSNSDTLDSSKNWLANFGDKPLLHSGDIHGFDKLNTVEIDEEGKTIHSSNYQCSTWIKADPTFEGLSQVKFEPKERVRIQTTLPEDKAGYQVIDRVEIRCDAIFNSQVYFNGNLNSIIGGRSSGKSVLLAAIAKKVKSIRPFSLSDMDYQYYVESISKDITVIWKDGKEENNREVEYFEQGYMHDIARNPIKLNEIVKGILVQKGKEQVIDSYNKSVNDNAKVIAGLVSDYFQALESIAEKEQKAREKGDVEGIKRECAKLQDEFSRISVLSISEAEKAEYEKTKQKIIETSQAHQLIAIDISELGKIRMESLLKDNIDSSLISMSLSKRQMVLDVIMELRRDIELKWNEKLEAMIQDSIVDQNALTKKVTDLTQNEAYLKVSQAYQNNELLSEFEERIKIQTDKLFEISKIHEEIENIKDQLRQTWEKLKAAHKAFYDKIKDIIPLLSDSNDGLEIKAKWKFDGDRYREILSSGLNLQGYDNQKRVEFMFSEFSAFEAFQFDLLEDLACEEVTLKGGFNSQTFASLLVSTNFFSLSYDIEYEADDFKKMSDGKKAFVVLKLLLDFNDKNCPILIDQPEDDLDNRAIYNELVQYLRKKKKLRQIIVATHNANIVVGADSELIICANQNGEKNANVNGTKFQYVTGSLEHSFEKRPERQAILESQGTREHVCEVLEGGNTAFKLREKKYSIKE